MDGRELFTETVRPGRESLLVMTVDTPADADDYVLDVDLVHEHVRWFGCGVRARVTVEPPVGAGLLGGRVPPGFLDAELASERASLSAELAQATEERRAAEARLHAIDSSAAIRIGRALARPLDAARGLARRTARPRHD